MKTILFHSSEIIPREELQKFLDGRDAQTDGIWMPQQGHTREELIRARERGAITFYYRITRRALSLWAYGPGCCHEINLYRWQLLTDVDAIFHQLDGMSFGPGNNFLDALGLPIEQVLEWSFFQDLHHFLPTAERSMPDVPAQPSAAALAPRAKESRKAYVAPRVELTEMSLEKMVACTSSFCLSPEILRKADSRENTVSAWLNYGRETAQEDQAQRLKDLAHALQLARREAETANGRNAELEGQLADVRLQLAERDSQLADERRLRLAAEAERNAQSDVLQQLTMEDHCKEDRMKAMDEEIERLRSVVHEREEELARRDAEREQISHNAEREDPVTGRPERMAPTEDHGTDRDEEERNSKPSFLFRDDRLLCGLSKYRHCHLDWLWLLSFITFFSLGVAALCGIIFDPVQVLPLLLLSLGSLLPSEISAAWRDPSYGYRGDENEKQIQQMILSLFVKLPRKIMNRKRKQENENRFTE